MIDRRTMLIGVTATLAGCVADQAGGPASRGPQFDPLLVAHYGPVEDEPFPIPAVDIAKVDPGVLRREMADPTGEAPGTIVVDPTSRYTYFVMEGGRALRYGVGVGREAAFNFVGDATIARKAEWPGWRPTPDMIAREPERYGPLAGGLPGGPRSPLGPRALYLYRDGRDTYYRLHGTVEPWSIGTTVSSGCIRFFNQDIIDLYRRVPVGSRVVVLPIGETLA